MKKIVILVLTMIGTSVLLTSCKPEQTETPKYSKVRIHFVNKADQNPLQFDQVNYTNEAGNNYSVSLLKYYISNFTFLKANGDSTRKGGIWLIDAKRQDMLTFEIDSIPQGDYTQIRMMLGVPFERNHSGAQDGYLDPFYGMIWAWSTGYIFFKHEGKFKDKQGKLSQIMMHLGTNRARQTITLPTQGWKADQEVKDIYVHFNLKNVYGPDRILDFNKGAMYMSDPGEEEWIDDMKHNLGKVWTVSSNP